MKKCCICGDDINTETPAILFVGKDGETKELCDSCADKTEILETSSDGSVERKRAVDYILLRCANSNDAEVNDYINKFIPKITPTENGIENMFYETSIWIKGLRAITWIMFIAIIIAGLCLGIAVDEGFLIGFLFFLGGIVTAFFTSAGMMIFLDMVSDISEIKQTLKSRSGS